MSSVGIAVIGVGHSDLMAFAASKKLGIIKALRRQRAFENSKT